MKHNKKRLLQALLVNDICWAIAAPFVYVARRLALSRENYIQRKTEDENIALCEKIFFKQEVKNGLFKGLQFNQIKPTGSSIYAKLLGSYELELEPVLKNLLTQNFTHLVNVGCDEGYYAVGIALFLPGINVIAFDCNNLETLFCAAISYILSTFLFAPAGTGVWLIGTAFEFLTISSVSIPQFFNIFEKNPLLSDKFLE